MNLMLEEDVGDYYILDDGRRIGRIFLSSQAPDGHPWFSAKELHLTNTGEKRLQAALKAWSRAQAQFETTSPINCPSRRAGT